MRGIERVLKAAVFIGALIGLSGTAFAQADPKVGVTFDQFVPAVVDGIAKVSQSRVGNRKSFTSQVTYKFDITNMAASSLNRPFLNLTLGNPGGTDFPTINEIISTSPPVDCPFTPDSSSSVYCEFGSLAPYTGSLTVYVVVNVPASGTIIEATWSGGGFEGNGGNNGCCQTGPFAYETTMVDNLIDQSYKFTLQTFVKRDGTELFTGDEGMPKPAKGSQAADLNATLATIPKLANEYPTDTDSLKKFAGSISESAPSCLNGSFKNNSCYESSLTVEIIGFGKEGTVPGVFEVAVDKDLGQIDGAPDELVDVVLRVDQTALKNGVKPEDIKLYYDGDEVKPCSAFTPYVTTRTDLPAGTLVLPREALPCHTAKEILKGQGVPSDLRGDLEVRGKHFKNGRWLLL